MSIAACAEAAVVRLGARAGQALRGAAYGRFVESLATALRGAGIPAGAVFEAGFGLSILEDSLPDGITCIVCPDVDLSVSRLVAVAQARAREGESESLAVEFRRFSCVPWGSLQPLSVSWLPERGSPLFGRTPRPLETAQLTVYATAEAPLPFNKAPRGREWVEQILNAAARSCSVRCARWMSPIASRRSQLLGGTPGAISSGL